MSDTRSLAGIWIDGVRATLARVQGWHGPDVALVMGHITAALEQQRPRAFVWAVAAFAVGVLIFFAWDREPSFGVGCVVIALGGLLAWMGQRPRFKIFGVNAIAAGLIAIGAGHMAAEIRTYRAATPILSRPLPATTLRGRVIDVERHPASSRVILSEVVIDGLPQEATPKRLRLTLPLKNGLPSVGVEIIARASLRPPMRPVLPDAFPFHRFLYFESVGGTGTAYAWSVDGFENAEGWDDAFLALIDVARRAIADKVAKAIPDTDDATVTAALIMGEQSAIPDNLQEAYRVSGLAHILSISGVHMSLLAAVVFFFMRRVLALFPALALRLDTKKVAAWTALAMLTVYILISGLSVPAIRSYLMIGVVMGAVLLDRTAISLHTVGWAALVLMAIYPDAVVGASFEMSFMAVLALVAVAEQVDLRVRWRTPEGKFTILPAIGMILAAAVVTDIAAGGSTAIFAIYHFNRFPTYSMVSNLFADSIIGLWVMPWGLLAGLAMPFGLEEIPVRLTGYGVGAVNAIARTVASWPHSQAHVPPMSAAALVVAASGLLFLCLWRGRLRLLGLVLIAAGLAQPWFATPPDIVVDEDSKVVAISDDHGHLVIRPGRGERFIREVWKERYGVSAVAWPEPGNEALNLRCDSDGCILHRNGQRVLIANSVAALAEDCEEVDAAVSLKAAHAFCPETEVVDRIDLRRRGAVAVWLTSSGVHTRFVADGMGERRWVAASRTPRLTDQRDKNTAPADSEVSSGEASPPSDPAP